MAVGPAGKDTNVSPQNYGGAPPKQEQVGEFKEALNQATASNDASGTQSSKGTEHSQDTSKSLPIILATRPPINLAQSKAGAAPAAAAPAATQKAPAATTQTVPGTSTPLPQDAVVDKKSKEATLQSGDFTVKVKPDRKANKGEDAKLDVNLKSDGAVTHGDISWSAHPKTENGKVTSVTIKKELQVQTTYGSKADPAADSAYGRGHIQTDKAAGNSSLRFHEGNHGQDYIDYVKTHPFPTIEIDKPITKQEYEKRMSEFKKQTEQYQKDMEANSKEHTDDVTDPPAATTPAAAK